MQLPVRSPTARFFAELCKLAGAVLDLDHVLRVVADLLTGILEARRVLLFLYPEPAGLPVLRVVRGFAAGAADSATGPLPETVLSQLLASRLPFALGDGGQPLRFLDQRRLAAPLRPAPALLGVPILLEQETLGLIAADRHLGGDAPAAQDIAVLQDAADFLSRLAGLHRVLLAREDRWRWENLALKASLAHGHQNLLVGRSPALAALKQLIRRVAESRVPVLLVGEPGVGKTLVARLIHEMSPRGGQPFVRVNCASLPGSLLAAELFGLEKGALPDATRGKPGRLSEAEGGTLLLTEVDVLPSALQANLLRLLEEREFQRLGGVKARQAEVRVLAASRENLAAAVAEGRFLAELYQKLSLFTVPVPALRERPQDILPLLNHFLDQVSREYGRRFYLTRQAEAVLAAYSWPENVRELKALVERLAVLADGPALDVADLPPHILGGRKKTEAETTHLSRLKELERREIVAALERHHWVQSQAAMELGLTLRQMGYRVKQFGLLNLVKKGRSRGPAPRTRP